MLRNLTSSTPVLPFSQVWRDRLNRIMQTSAFAVGYNNTQNKKHGFIKDFCPIILKCLRLALTLHVTLLQEAGYNYILGARIKSESASVKQWILSLEKVDKACYNYKRENGERLILIWVAHWRSQDYHNISGIRRCMMVIVINNYILRVQAPARTL